jgi:hypothetical protein
MGIVDGEWKQFKITDVPYYMYVSVQICRCCPIFGTGVCISQGTVT